MPTVVLLVAREDSGEGHGFWLIAGEVCVLNYPARERELGALKVRNAK
jgi:hypothetical protein